MEKGDWLFGKQKYIFLFHSLWCANKYTICKHNQDIQYENIEMADLPSAFEHTYKDVRDVTLNLVEGTGKSLISGKL